MALLLLSQFVMTNQPLAYGMLLLATASLGIGFGLTVPSLNTFAAAFFPEKIDRAVLILNALLGLGTALAPVFVAIFVGLGIWWGLPLLVAVLLLGLLMFSLRLPLRVGSMETAARDQAVRPRRHPGALLGLRHIRPALRHRRDDERQLGDPLHDQRPGRRAPPWPRWR